MKIRITIRILTYIGQPGRPC